MPNPILAISFIFIFLVIICLSTPLMYGDVNRCQCPPGGHSLLGEGDGGPQKPWNDKFFQNGETLLLAGILTGEVRFDLNLEYREDYGYCGFEGGGG